MFHLCMMWYNTFFQVVAFKRNIYGYLNHSSDIDGGMTHLSVKEKGSAIPVPVVLFSLKQPKPTPEVQVAPAPSKGDSSNMFYLRYIIMYYFMKIASKQNNVMELCGTAGVTSLVKSSQVILY